MNKSLSILEDADIADREVDVWLLAEQFLKVTKEDYLKNPDITVTDTKAFEDAVAMRADHIPLQHITGVQNFCGFDFKVDERALVPRFDTEVLVEKVSDYVKDNEMRILDMCTGTGCIAIALDKMCENAKVVASDISEEALALATENNEKLGANVEFVKSDLFDEIGGLFDVIVSNPPYIKTDEIEELMEEVKVHDPRLALDGDVDGLKFYRIISASAISYLKIGGRIFYEIGYDQASDVKTILEGFGYTDIEVIKDLSGNDRVITATKR
ncbi:MAG: peptide chain release factor N(5)-glutamine methyltransferase [Eubacterium sp.]|nr:peptide chain release factor N(5)-glutamine methyltransferase [Eubacterium sp.]